MLNTRDFFISLTNNWPAKILSIMLAIGLFIFQRINTLDSRGFDVPLNLTSNQHDLAPTKLLPEKVRVVAQTTRAELENISENDIIASIDLSSYEEPGTYDIRIEIHPSINILDLDSLALSVYPRDIKITLDPREGKYVSVKPVYKGSVAPGYELVSQSITPNQVYVEGPQTIVAGIISVPTEQIDITGRDTNIMRIVRVGTYNPLITLSESNFQFSAELKSIKKIEEWRDLPITFTNLPENLHVTSTDFKGFIRLQGNERDISTYTPEAGVLFVDCSPISSPGNYPDMPVAVHVPDNFTVLQYVPDTLAITITDAP